MSARTIATGVIALLYFATTATAQEALLAPPRYDSAPEISIDGELSEAVWGEATRIGPLVRTTPVTEGFPAYQTTARFFYTAEALYVGFDCEVPEAERHIALSPRDDGPRGDYVGISLDTFRDTQRAYQFRISAAGSLADQRYVAGQGTDRAWNTPFDAEVAHTDEGYTVEVRIPFRDLRFSEAADQVWGLQVSRWLWSSQEEARWTSLDLSQNNTIAQYGVVELTDIRSGSDFQLLPNLTLSWLDDPDVSNAGCEFEAGPGTLGGCGVEASYGLGARYALGPALSLDAVFNPDFSQVEADPSQITLNERFATFLSERRPFFLEGADIFDVGSLVYTRSINQPLVGLKLTGNIAERTRVGVLVGYDLEPPDSILDDGFTVPERDDGDSSVQATTSIVRLQQDVLDSSRVGILLVDREYTGEETAFSRLAGADARLELGNWVFEAGTAATWSEDFEDAERTGFLTRESAVWEIEHWRAQLSHDFVSDDFRDEAGFIRRTGFHSLFAKGDYYHRSERSGFRFISPGINGKVLLDPDGGAPVEGYSEANVFWDFGDRTMFFAEVLYNYEDYEGETFHYPSSHFSIWTDYLPEFSPSVSLSVSESIVRDSDLWPDGSPILGQSFGFTGDVSSRPISQLDLYARIRLRSLYEDGLFTESLSNQRILRFKMTYLFSNEWNLRFITEHVHPDDELSFDTLLSFIPSPGTVLFLGYRDVEDVSDGWNLISRGVFFKVSYLWAL